MFPLQTTKHSLGICHGPVLYSDGSTELGTFTASMSSGTVSVNIDADDDDVCTYAVTFLK